MVCFRHSRSAGSWALALTDGPSAAWAGKSDAQLRILERRFGGSQTVVGQNITLDSRPREIVGIMPQGFQVVDADFDVITPLAFDRERILAGFGFHGIARLKPGKRSPTPMQTLRDCYRLDGLMVERSRQQSAYLRDLENHAHHSLR